MAKELGELYVGVSCDNCGVHGEGKPAKNGKIRCGKCGKFGKKAEQYCAKHDIHYEGLFPNDSHCPMCREERNQRDRMEHEMTRDPTVEPW